MPERPQLVAADSRVQEKIRFQQIWPPKLCHANVQEELRNAQGTSADHSLNHSSSASVSVQI